MINKKYNVTARVLTPLSIGQGAEKDWVYGIDYLTKEDEYGNLWLYHLDLSKMVVAGVDVNKMAQTFAGGNPGAVNLLVGSKLEKVSDCKMRLPVSSVEVEKALSNPIKTFLRNQLTGRPVLAGSSLKGALRSILFTYLRAKGERDNESVFGKMNDGSDFMRFIRVGDFEFEETGLVNTKIFNLHQAGQEWEGGWKHSGNNTTCDFSPIGFNTIYECLLPNATAGGYIMFADTLFDKIQQFPDKKADILHSDVATLCDIVNNHTLDYLDREFNFFETYHSDKSQCIINSMTDIYNECIRLTEEEPHSCILKMSAGSGFHSITGDWQYDEYIESENHLLDRKRGRELPKSRKIAVSGTKPFSLMGFIKLTFN